MAKRPTKPQKGDRVLQSIYNTVCDIVDYIPSLEVTGDNKTTSVSHTAGGTTIHAIQQGSYIQGGKGKEYTAGSALYLSGNQFNVDVDGITVQIVNNKLSAVGGGGGTIVVEDKFGVPNLSALNYNNQPLGEGGNGISWLIPVSAGQRFTYSTGASGNVNASYAPAKGKSGSAFAITRDELSTIPQDGYVRITAFDDGKHFNQCLRVLDGTTDWNQGLPLYKFSNWSSAVIPSGGRYTTVQLTSTRLNAQEQEEIYTLPNPIINNMLSGGKYITIQETDEYDVKLQYPLINCTLHGDETTVKILEDGTISAIGGGSGPDNDTTYTGGRFIYVEAEGENPHTISCTLSGLDELANTPGFVTSSNFYAGKNIQLSCEYFTANNNVNIGTAENPVYERIDVPVANSIKIINLLSGGTNIEVDDQTHAINCTLSGLDQLANTTTNYITLADVIPHIPASGLTSTALLDSNDKLTAIQYSLISAFYNDLTTISSRPSTGNFILSSSAGTLSWQQNTGGSTPTPTPGGGQNIVYITAEGEYDLVANTHYFVLLDPVLSGNQNYTAENQQWYKIYKYMWYDKDTGANQGQTILTTTVRYEDEYYNYGAYKTPGDPDSWMDYNEGGVFGAKLNFPVPTQTTHITITAFRNSNSIVCAPYGGIIWDWSNPQYYPISGTIGLWFGQFLQRMDKTFIYDPATTRWYVVGN